MYLKRLLNILSPVFDPGSLYAESLRFFVSGYQLLTTNALSRVPDEVTTIP